MLELAAVSTDPDVAAFMGGVRLGLAVVFLVLVGLGGLALVRRILAA